MRAINWHNSLPSSSQFRVLSRGTLPNMQLERQKQLRLVVGNTYNPIPGGLATMSRSGIPKLHDWTLFVRPENPEDAPLISQVSGGDRAHCPCNMISLATS